MADRSGNVLRPPGITDKPEVAGDEILASYARFTQKGVTLAKDQGILAAGTVLGRITASKKFGPYSDAAVDGRAVARGILRQAVDTTGEDKLANIVISGIVKNSKLTGLDAAAIADLNARQDTDRDVLVF